MGEVCVRLFRIVVSSPKVLDYPRSLHEAVSRLHQVADPTLLQVHHDGKLNEDVIWLRILALTEASQAYIGTYYAIGSSWLLTLANYFIIVSIDFCRATLDIN